MKFQVSSRLYIFLFILLKLFLNYYELFFTSSLKLLYGKISLTNLTGPPSWNTGESQLKSMI